MSNSLSLRSYTSETHTHSHDFAQLVLPLRGQLELEIGGKSGIVNEATGAYIHSNTQHCFASGEDNLFLVVDFLNTSANWNCHHMPSFMQLNAPLKNYLAFAHSYLGSHSNPQTDSLLYQLLINLLTSELTTPDRCVIQVKLWIEQHLATPIDIGHLAKQCHISKSQLQRRFKQNTGFSVAQYWRMKRLEYAQYLLRNSDLSIEDIAYQIGYENLSAFSRRFQQSFAISPSQWRNLTLAAKNVRVEDNHY